MIQFGNGKQLLQLIPKNKFDDLSRKWSMNRGVRRFSAWDQVCTFIMAFTLKLESLREVQMVLSVPRSTFSDANTRRHCGFFQELSRIILEEIARLGGNRKARRCVQRILDSTEIDVHGSIVNQRRHWRKKKSYKKQAGAKLHVIWDFQDQVISDYRITSARVGDSPVAKQFKISPGVTYVFDRAYTELELWLKIINAKAHFVSRLKRYKHTRRDTKKIKTFPKDKVGVLWEGNWRPCKQVLRAWQRKGIRFPALRRILYRDPVTKKEFEFITSNRRYSAKTIADIYKNRWSIELLFKWMKGHLGVRRLAMKDINSIKIQLAMAVVLQLLLQLYRLTNKIKASLWECLRELRTTLALNGLDAQASPDEIARTGPLNKGIPTVLPTI